MPRWPTVLRDHPAQPAIDHAAAKRAFFSVMNAWGVRDDEAAVLLGNPSRATYYTYKRGEGGPLSHDALERVSYVLGIFKALEILFPDPARADAWLKRGNDAPLFGGRSALDRMLSGNVADLFVVRQYLDAQRGG